MVNDSLLWFSSTEHLQWSKRESRGHSPSALCQGDSGNKKDLGEDQRCDTSETGPPEKQGDLLIPAVIGISGGCIG